MRLPVRQLVLGAFALLAPMSHAAAQGFTPAPVPPTVGSPIADLVLPTIDGTQTIALSQFRGQKVLLLVFASW